MTPSLAAPNSNFVCAGRLHGRGDCKGDGTCGGGGKRGGGRGYEEGRMRRVDQELKQNIKLAF